MQKSALCPFSLPVPLSLSSPFSETFALYFLSHSLITIKGSYKSFSSAPLCSASTGSFFYVLHPFHPQTVDPKGLWGNIKRQVQMQVIRVHTSVEKIVN